MAQTTLEKIVEDAKTLTPGEQKQLRGLLDEWLGSEESRREALMRELEAKGVIQPHKPGWQATWSKFDPVSIQGKPLSETVMEERGERG